MDENVSLFQVLAGLLVASLLYIAMTIAKTAGITVTQNRA